MLILNFAHILGIDQVGEPAEVGVVADVAEAPRPQKAVPPDQKEARHVPGVSHDLPQAVALARRQ